jgi:hypothetical protein
MSDLTAAGEAASAGQPAAVHVAWVVRRARELLDDGNRRSARELVCDAMDQAGRCGDLLWILAEVEFADDDVMAGRDCLAEALAASGQEPASVARQIRALRSSGCWREALLAAEAVPAGMRQNPMVRSEVGNFYRSCGCPAQAAESYGSPHGLRRPVKAARMWCWLRSGGPAASLHRKAREREEVLLGILRRPPGHISTLADIADLDSRQAQYARILLETFNYRYQRRWYGLMGAYRAGYRMLPLAALVPAWLVLLAVVYPAGFAHGLASTSAFAAVSAVVAATPVIVLVVALIKPSGYARFRLGITTQGVAVFFFVVVVLEAAAGEGYVHRVLPTAGWSSAVILGLAASPAAVACLPAALVIANVVWGRSFRRLTREDPLLNVLDSLLLVLHDLRSSRHRRGLGERLGHSRELEFAARCLTQDVLPSYLASYLGSGDWLTRRIAGWAEAIRHMQRQVIASVPGGNSKLEALLAHEVRCLVTCDLGALAWREPPPPAARRVAIRRQVIAITRAVVVAVLPLAAVLTSQTFVHASAALFGWARVTAGIWALLYVLLSIDPAIRDKIGAANDIAGLLHTTFPTTTSGNDRRQQRAAQ